jgi:hypothetical protein
MKMWHAEDSDDINQIINKEKIDNHKDIFLKEFDLGWSKNIKDKDFFKKWSLLPGLEIVDDGQVEYLYNSDRFRCDEFTNEHNNKKHILFAGCSETEGVGSPLDTVWSKIIYNSLSQNNDLSGYFSLGKSGWGWQKIINNFLIYSKKYGYPEYLIVLLPRVSRFYTWINDDWQYIQKFFSIQDHDFSKEEHRKLWIDFVMGWKLFELYCESNNVKLIWSSWDYMENDNLEKTGKHFNGFFSIKDTDVLNYFKEARPDGKRLKYDVDRRDGHNGIIEHACYSKLFLNNIKERGWLN